MKRILAIIFCLTIVTGCTKVSNESIDSLVNNVIKSKRKLTNIYNRGFKYYLPYGLKSVKQDEYNNIIKSKYYDYYLYVDLVSYFDKVKKTYEVTPDIYYSRVISNGKKFGVINVKQLEQDVFLVDITYNYARIQTKTKKDDIAEVVTNSLIIANSIIFNDNVISELLKEKDFNGQEEQINVIEGQSDTNYLDFDEDEDDEGYYDEDTNVDPEVIN